MPLRERVGKWLDSHSRAKSLRPETQTAVTAVGSSKQSQTSPAASLGQDKGQPSVGGPQAVKAVAPGQQSGTSGTQCPTVVLTDPSDCWGRAFQRLESEQPKLFEYYTQQLYQDGKVFGSSIGQLQDLVQTKTSDRETKQIVLGLRGKDVKLREFAEKVIKFAIWSKDLVTAATASQPYAAIAMAGVSILLPLMLQPSTETTKMLEGLEQVSSLVKLYQLREKLYLSTAGDHLTQIRDAIIQLYLDILVYEATMLRHLSHNTIARGTSSVLNPGRWKDLVGAVNDSASVCASFEQYLDTVEERRLQQEQREQLEKSYEALRSIKDSIDAFQGQQLKGSDHADQSAFFNTFSSPYSRDKNRNPRRVPDTCEWFLQNDEFQNWRDSSTARLLWLSADPGCGKSVLSRCLVDENKLSNHVLTTSVCYFFFKDDDEQRKLASNALTAIIHQLVVQNPSLWNYVKDAFNQHHSALTEDFSELWDIFIAISNDSNVGSIICLFDALDECEEQSRDELVRVLTEFYLRNTNFRTSTVKFLITSRPYETIKASFRDVARSVDYVHFDGDARSDQISREIDLVIDYQIPQIASQLSLADQSEVSRHLKAVGNRTYLWAHLIFDIIKKRVAAYPTASRIREGVLQNIPRSLYDIYEDILSKIPSEECDRARILFRIVLAAKRPLSLMELVTALETAAREDPQSYKDLDLPSEDGCLSMIRDLCGLLLDVRDGIVVFLHQTAREFLIANASATKSATSDMPGQKLWQHSMEANENDYIMALACMRLLNFTDFHQWPPWLGVENSDFPTTKRDTSEYDDCIDIQQTDDDYEGFDPTSFFLLYAARNWFVHFRTLDSHTVLLPLSQGSSTSLLILARMIMRCDSSTFATWYSLEVTTDKFFHEEALPVACGLNSLDLCKSLVYEDLIICALNHGSLTPISDANEISRRTTLKSKKPGALAALSAACEKSHVEIIEMLIAAGADINEVFDDKSPLSRACSKGRLDVVRCLVGHGAITTGTNKQSPNTIYFATRHTAIAQFLLAHRSFSARELTRTFSHAVDKGHLESLDVLLTAGVDIDGFVNHKCALFLAAHRGDIKTLRWLLDKGANLHIKNRYGQNVLCLVAEPRKIRFAFQRIWEQFKHNKQLISSGQMMEHLLELGASTNEADRDSQMLALSVLSWDMSKWRPDDWLTLSSVRYSNALHHAIFRGRSDLVSILLEHGTLPNLPNFFGETSLTLAEEALIWRQRFEQQRSEDSKSSSMLEGHEKIIKMLRDHGAARYNVVSDEVQLSMGPGLNALLDLYRGAAEKHFFKWRYAGFWR